MATMFKLSALTLCASALLAACGGGGGVASEPAPPPVVTEQMRIAAANATVAGNAKCSVGTLGSYYWEIGDASGVKVSGSVGTGAPTATTTMKIFSASKWLYASNVLQKKGFADAQEMKFLNFTSGYSSFGNAPICLGSTVEECLVGRDALVPETIDHFAYDSGHMQHHAANFMGLAKADNAALAADLNATVGNFGFSYDVQQPASGVSATPQAYAQFLRRLLRSELVMASALGASKVCAQQAAPGCGAKATPDSIGTEAWNYSLGHWVEDDPAVGDHAFSSAGGGGFYPWIDSGKTIYGIVARMRNTEPGAGYFSAECGRLVRQAWRTGATVLATRPTP